MGKPLIRNPVLATVLTMQKQGQAYCALHERKAQFSDSPHVVLFIIMNNENKFNMNSGNKDKIVRNNVKSPPSAYDQAIQRDLLLL